MDVKIYRLKHKATGLYYAKGTLSEKGKFYTTGCNYLSYIGGTHDFLYVYKDSKLYKKYSEVLDRLDTGNGGWRGVEIEVQASDFEKEYLPIQS